VAPADGKVVYVHLAEDGRLPIALKRGQPIRLEEVAKTALSPGRYWHVGIFMFPWSVHVNRIPVDGEVAFTLHHAHPNRPMSNMYIRGVLGLKPMYEQGLHITENERNTVLVDGDLPTYVVQIADAYVNKIECWVSPGDKVCKGQRLGRIIMGSQVDLIFPDRDGMTLVVTEGQLVKAGETIVARY
jgi:phosphatidylserine decarboxylase